MPKELPERPWSHQAESRSRRRFLAVLPDSWVASEVHPDYGIDYWLEIFEEGRPTGRMIAVQVKAQSEQNVRLRVPTVNYYFLFPYPTLLIRHDPVDDTMFFEDVKASILRITLERGRSWQSQETVAFPVCRRIDGPDELIKLQDEVFLHGVSDNRLAEAGAAVGRRTARQAVEVVLNSPHPVPKSQLELELGKSGLPRGDVSAMLEDPLLGSIFVEGDGGFSLRSLDLNVILSLIQVLGETFPSSLNLKTAGKGVERTVGAIVAEHVGRGFLPPAIFPRLLKSSWETWCSCLEGLVEYYPAATRMIAGLRLESALVTSHECKWQETRKLLFEDAGLGMVYEECRGDRQGNYCELACANGECYVVELAEAKDLGTRPIPSLVVIASGGPKGPSSVRLLETPMAKKVRLVRIIGKFSAKADPLVRVYSLVPSIGIPPISFEGVPLILRAGQTIRQSSTTKGEIRWYVDDWPLVEARMVGSVADPVLPQIVKETWSRNPAQNQFIHIRGKQLRDLNEREAAVSNLLPVLSRDGREILTK